MRKYQTSIENFAKHLRRTYGASSDEKRSEFACLKQQKGESPPEFLRRIELSYFRIKGLTVPSELEDHQKSDIKWSFLSGLTDPAVKKHMLLKDPEYENLGTEARKIEKQLNGLEKNVYSVNKIAKDNESLETSEEFPSNINMSIASIELRLTEIERLLQGEEQ